MEGKKIEKQEVKLKIYGLISDSTIQALITKEFKSKTLGVTEQYLEILDVYYDDDEPRIERIDREGENIDGVIIAYLPVVDEWFHLAVYIDAEKIEIFNIGTESRNSVVFCATSDLLSADELTGLTTLSVQHKRNKGDFKPNKRAVEQINQIEIEPNPEPDAAEDKITKLLELLLQDRRGVADLVARANGYVKVIMDFHHGNQLLGGFSLTKDQIEKLATLNLGIEVSLAAWGKSFE